MLAQAFYALEVPPAPPGAPEYLERLLSRLQAALEAGTPRAAREALRDSIGFLTRYFGDVLATTSDRLTGEDSHAALSVANATEVEPTMDRALRLMLQRQEPTVVALRSVFFREQLGGEFIPYPHTRLLMRDGLLANGAHTLTQWLAYGCVPCSDEECQEELDSLIPILSQWLTAASPFFLECRYDYLVQPPHAFHALGLRGLEGGTRIPMSRVKLLTRFRDLQTGLPLRLRDMDFAPETPVARPPEPVPEPQLPTSEEARTQTWDVPEVFQPEIEEVEPPFQPEAEKAEPAPLAQPEVKEARPEPAPRPQPDVEPLAALVRQLLATPQERSSPARMRAPRTPRLVPAGSLAPTPLAMVPEAPVVEKRRDELELLRSGAPLAVMLVLIYLFLLSL